MSLEPISGVPSNNLASNLGNLAQAARKKQLNVARGILIFVGIVTLAVNGFSFAHAKQETEEVVQQEIRGVQARGQQADPVSVENERSRILRFCQAIYGSAIVVGTILIVLGFLVHRFPIPATVLGLVLYIGGIAVFGYIVPATLAQGIIIRIIIVVALIKSIQAAVAYQKGVETPQVESNPKTSA
jgi:hypothetical protein